MNFRKDLLYLFLLLGLGIIFWGEALAPGKLFFFRDIPAAIMVKKLFWSGSSGPTLWSPYSFFGVPYASNPQSEAFYPLNFFFSLFGPERGVVYDVVLHHLFFLLTFYLALRRVGFKEETSLIGSVGFGFGGYLISLASIPLFFRTIAWLGLLIICLNEALEKKWLRWSLLLGLVMAVQIMGGEIQLAGMSWVLAFGAVVLAPKRMVRFRDLFKASGAMVLGLIGGVIMNLPQIALAGELLPLSNRAGGMSLKDAIDLSLNLSQLGSLFIPHYLISPSAGLYWDLGFFFGFPYLLSHYLGVTLLLLVILSFAGPDKWKGLIWLALAFFGLVMILGDTAGVYTFLYKHLPGFSLFRSPDKFFLFLNFGFVLLAVYGSEFLSGRKQFFPWGSSACILAAVAIVVLLLAYPLRVQEFKDNYYFINRYLFWRNILRISVFFLIGLGLVLLAGKMRVSWLGLGLALVLFLDLFFAHHRLNPVTTIDAFQPNEFIRGFLAKEKERMIRPRIFSVLSSASILPRRADTMESFKDFPATLEFGWDDYFGLNNIRWAGGSLYPIEVNKFKRILGKSKWPENDMILARAGVDYLYDRDSGFIKIPGTFPRAMIFYQVRAFPDQDQIIELWSSPEFPADRVLLIENEPGKLTAGSGLLNSDPARIVEYQNEKVTLIAEAREAGWLLLLDSYYPGWKAEVDGQPVEVLRADGFFRAVRIPAGRHKIVFGYFPEILKRSVWVSGLGFLIWLGLIVSTRTREKRKEKAI